MKIGIHTWGSEGDVRPFLILADGLAQAGHEIRLAYSAVDGRDYAARLAGARYAHRGLKSPRSPEQLRRIGGEVFADTNPLRQLARAIEELLEPVIDEMTQSACELAKWADILVLHPFAHPLAAAAEVERKPFVCVHPAAAHPTRAFPPPGFLHLGALNSLSWRLTLALLSAKLIGSVNGVRVRLGLAPIKRIGQQLEQSAMDLVAMSSRLLPRPDDWPEKIHLSGFLSPRCEPRHEKLDAELQAFLAGGPPPVYDFGVSWSQGVKFESRDTNVSKSRGHATASASTGLTAVCAIDAERLSSFNRPKPDKFIPGIKFLNSELSRLHTRVEL